MSDGEVTWQQFFVSVGVQAIGELAVALKIVALFNSCQDVSMLAWARRVLGTLPTVMSESWICMLKTVAVWAHMPAWVGDSPVRPV